jgi:metallo-beta-lactamase class B
MRVRDGKATQDVIFFCSPTVPPQYRLVGNTHYPTVAEDYRKQFATLKSLPCDVFLASHGSFFSLDEKRAQLVTTPGQNPFVDPKGCRTFISLMEQRFKAALAKQMP